MNFCDLFMKKKSKGVIVLIALFTGVAVVAIPLLLTVVLWAIFPEVDAYVLTGFSFFLLGSVAMWLVPILLVVAILPKGKKLTSVKEGWKKYKAFWVLVGLPIMILAICLGGGAYTYFKDIKQGPVEAIMTDAEVEVRSSVKNSQNTYLTGYIDEEKVWLQLTGDAKDTLERGESYEELEIKYYEYIGEVFEAEE